MYIDRNPGCSNLSSLCMLHIVFADDTQDKLYFGGSFNLQEYPASFAG